MQLVGYLTEPVGMTTIRSTHDDAIRAVGGGQVRVTKITSGNTLLVGALTPFPTLSASLTGTDSLVGSLVEIRS